MPKTSFIRAIIIGNITNDFVISIDGKAYNGIPGGPLFYAGAGAKMWNDEIGLIGRVSQDLPKMILQTAEARGFETRGISADSRTFESRRFFAWRDGENVDLENLVAHYAHIGSTFPRELLGYHLEDIPSDESIWRNVYSNLKMKLPVEYMDSTATLLCPLDFATQAKMVNLLGSSTITTLMIAPSDQYMTPEYLEKLPVILKGASAFLPTENQLKKLCHHRTGDIWESMQLVAETGCQVIIVSCGTKGYCMYDSVTGKKYKLPAYPTRWVDPTGMNDVFFGAFLGEYKKSYDLCLALLHGCVSASISVEGTGPFYCLDALPELAEARVERMRSLLSLI
jgi:ribokinase